MALRDLLNRAEKTQTGADYQFIDVNSERGNEYVIQIPQSLDKRSTIIRRLTNNQVEIQADIDRLMIEDGRVSEELAKHRLAFAKEMLDLGIPSPLAQTPPATPETE